MQGERLSLRSARPRRLKKVAWADVTISPDYHPRAAERPRFLRRVLGISLTDRQFGRLLCGPH